MIEVSSWCCPPKVCQAILLGKYDVAAEFSRRFLSFDESKFWGAYYNLFESNEIAPTPDGFFDSAPKRIDRLLVINPQTKLLLSVHSHKAERWIPIDGNTSLTVGSELNKLRQQRLLKGEIFDVEAGTIHNLNNETDDIAVVYEIQTGFCSDNDVVRL